MYLHRFHHIQALADASLPSIVKKMVQIFLAALALFAISAVSAASTPILTNTSTTSTTTTTDNHHIIMNTTTVRPAIATNAPVSASTWVPVSEKILKTYWQEIVGTWFTNSLCNSTFVVYANGSLTLDGVEGQFVATACSTVDEHSYTTQYSLAGGPQVCFCCITKWNRLTIYYVSDIYKTDIIYPINKYKLLIQLQVGFFTQLPDEGIYIWGYADTTWPGFNGCALTLKDPKEPVSFKCGSGTI